MKYCGIPLDVFCRLPFTLPSAGHCCPRCTSCQTKTPLPTYLLCSRCSRRMHLLSSGSTFVFCCGWHKRASKQNASANLRFTLLLNRHGKARMRFARPENHYKERATSSDFQLEHCCTRRSAVCKIRYLMLWNSADLSSVLLCSSDAAMPLYHFATMPFCHLWSLAGGLHASHALSSAFAKCDQRPPGSLRGWTLKTAESTADVHCNRLPAQSLSTAGSHIGWQHPGQHQQHGGGRPHRSASSGRGGTSFCHLENR